MNMDTWMCQCLNPKWLGSITNCIHTYSNSTEEMVHAYNHIIKRCQLRAHTNYTLSDMEAYQKGSENSLIDSTQFSKKTNVTSPLYIPEREFSKWYRDFKKYNDFITNCEKLGWGCVGFWIVALCGYGILRYLDLFGFLPSALQKVVHRADRLAISYTLLDLNLVQLAIFLVFVVLVVLSCAINYDVPVSAYLTTSYFKTIDLLSFRTDIIGFSIMPLIYLMGIRNSPFQIAGYLNHNTMIKFHKLVSGVFFILALIHSAIWTDYARKPANGGYAVWAKDSYFYWGIIGTTVAGLMLLSLFKLVQQTAYECFLFFHKLFSVLFIVAMWKHCNTLGWMGWVYSMAAILVYDRVCRISKILINGGVNKAKLSIKSSSMLTLDLEKPKGLKVYPGCYIYLTFLPHWSHPAHIAFQSHPFSVLSSGNRLLLSVNVKRGITRELARLQEGTYNVLIDGPYGTSVKTNVSGFSNVVGIATGNSLMTLLDIFMTLDYGCLKWVFRDPSQLDVFEKHLEMLQDKGIEVEVFYTGEEKVAFPKDLNLTLEKPSAEDLLATKGPKKVYFCGSESLLRDTSRCLGDQDDIWVGNSQW